MATLPKLMQSSTSPYARKVRIFATEKKINFEIVPDVPWNPDTKTTQYNPLGKVPVWIADDGNSYFDSRMITEYLEGQYPGVNLYPTNFNDRMVVKKIEALADGIMDSSLAIFAERKKRPAELQYPDWVNRQFGKIHGGLKMLSKELGDKPYFFGNSLTIADIAVVACLGYVGLRFSEDFDWKKEYPILGKFYDRMMERPSIKESVPVL